MADTAYEDGLTPEEEEELRKLDGANPVPPADEQPGAPADQPADPAAAPKPAEAAPAPTDDEEFQAWLKQHEGKTPEEISHLAFQQSKRASREAYEKRRAGESLSAFQERLKSTLERTQARRAALEDQRRDFNEKLERDPDAASKLVFEKNLDNEAAEIEREEDDARMDAAIAMARSVGQAHGFDFDAVAPEVFNFGMEMGFSKGEMAAIRDGREILTLLCARNFANLYKQGIVDMQGNLLQMPGAVAATDPRLAPAADPVSTLGSLPLRAPGGAKSIEDQMAALNGLSDEELAKIPEDEINRLLKAAG